MFTCPATGTALAYDLPSDEIALEALWATPPKINCPVCQVIHETAYRDAYVTAVTGQFECVPAEVKRASVH